ncbi:UDP-glycosyltransferase 89A2-like [Tripterygium wilfordii]|uniref:UDP-glycosyltransferase 89A2-like n=1 Tax=Tripterygium wilfordii TaxID=458696 RepID=A0A7J7C0Z4_TRIWF|nr:UDP-glycosyltransferase 89A2-like [Tripterygium wilfordii]KAF5727793.1 UDP-glycosyltransferase 89A2-like [Tripterygium wilfordii]
MSINNNETPAPQAPHILIFPYPAQGHTLPLLDFTHQLALRGLTLTILTTPKNLPTLSHLLQTHPQIKTLTLPFPSHPSLPPGVENVKELGNAGNLPIMAALPNLRDPIIHWFRSNTNPPVAIISDFFLGWTQKLAQELNIPRIAFFSSGAFLVSVLDYCWNHVANDSDVVEFVGLPRTPSFKEEHLPSIFRRYRGGDPVWENIKDAMVANIMSWGCIFNTFEDLESEYLEYLKKLTGHDRVYGVGPISLLGPSKRELSSKADSNKELLGWLDGCPDGSVLYVCFGSQKLLSKNQMQALATGLERSGTRFIWVVNTGSAQLIEEGIGVGVPDGFEERVAGRGMVVRGWAPQVLLLSHNSVGGFLSHCGWNSVLEGLVGGVVILGWPMEADQYVNARLLVEDMGIAVRVCEGAGSVPDPDELASAIAESLSEDVKVKVRAKEMRDKALTAVKFGGSSWRDLDMLVKELSQLQMRGKHRDRETRL